MMNESTQASSTNAVVQAPATEAAEGKEQAAESTQASATNAVAQVSATEVAEGKEQVAESTQASSTNAVVQAPATEAAEGKQQAAETAQASSTNVVVQTTTPEPVKPVSPRQPVDWTWPSVAIVAVVALLWIAKKLKASTATFEKSVEDELVDSVLDVVAKDAPDRAALRQELADAVANGGALRSGPLAAILRIEDGYEKKSPGRYLRRISVLRRKDASNASLAKIECELGWEYIPEGVREQFIKTRQKKVVRLVYDAKESGT